MVDKDRYYLKNMGALDAAAYRAFHNTQPSRLVNRRYMCGRRLGQCLARARPHQFKGGLVRQKTRIPRVRYAGACVFFIPKKELSMSEIPDPARSARIRAVIDVFLQERLNSKLEKLAEDDPKRTELTAQYQPSVWLADAARRVRQIQAVTHSLKPIHPDARGTNLYVPPEKLPQHAEVGSHVLGNGFVGDVVGNAAALDVYKFLKLEIDGRSLLDALLAEDVSALRALDDDVIRARQWRDAFVSLTRPDEGQAASHTRAKQIYWLVGDDPTDDAAYHLLAPLYATSLTHAVYVVLQEDRFGETNKAARQARRERRAHDGVFRDYPDLAVQKLGGTKPQNISQLNSERRGSNYLLSMAPPIWKSRQLRSLRRLSSVFDRIYGMRDEVRVTVRALRGFLEKDPPANLATRDRVDTHVDRLIDELVQLAAEYQHGLPAGWSRDPDVDLVEAERLWLDPRRAALPEEQAFRAQWLRQDWPVQIGHRFANWLNTQLEGRLPVGDAEFREWRKELLLDEDEGGWAQMLHRLRKDVDAPIYIPSRKGIK